MLVNIPTMMRLSSSTTRSTTAIGAAIRRNFVSVTAKTDGRRRVVVAQQNRFSNGGALSSSSAIPKNGWGRSSLFHTSAICPFSIKTVEVWSTGGSNTDGTINSNRAKIVEVKSASGSSVETGDVVAVLENTSTQEKIEVRAPFNGTVQEWKFNVGDEVKIGDGILDIDTTSEEQVTVHPDALVLYEHIKSNQGRLDDDFLHQLLTDTEDIEKLKHMSTFLRDTHLPTSIQIKALRILERILELQQAEGSTATSKEIASTHGDLGILLQRLGDMNSAIVHMEHALQLRKQDIPQEDVSKSPELVGIYMFLGHLKNQSGDLDGAYDALQHALEIQQNVLGKEHVLVAASYNNLGAIKYQNGQFDEAVKQYETAVEIYEKQLGAHADTAGAYNNLGIALKQTDPQRAVENIQKSLKMRQDVLGVDHIDTATSHSSLGQIMAEYGHFDGALEQYTATLLIQTKEYGDETPIVAATHNDIGAVHYQQRNYQQALESYTKGLNILRKSPQHPGIPGCLNNVGLTYYQMNELDKAMEAHQEAYDMLMKQFGNNDKHPVLATTIGSMGNVYKARQEYETALDYYKRSHQMLEQSLGLHHPDVGSSYNNMGQVLSGMKQFDEAVTVYKAALEIFQKTVGENHPNTGACHFNCGLALLEQKLDEEKKTGVVVIPTEEDPALRQFVKARDVWKLAFGPDHPQVNIAQQHIEQITEKMM